MHSHASVNRLYRLVWNESLNLWTAVAETARGRGKTGTGKRRTAAILAMSSSLLLLPPAMAGPNNINPDGRTQTSVSSNGGATDVRTSTFSGSNALNSFSSFGVGDGQTVNLHVPGHSANLINLVSGQGVTVNGILNGIKNNQVGGNVFFATPNGFVVGTHGVINVGSLTVSTPTQAFVTDFFSAPSAPVEDALNALLSGSAPLNASGYISINGIVNASGSVRLNGGSVNVSGAINQGARFVNATSDFTDVVNANGLEEGTKVVEKDGRMVIVADTGTGTGSSSDGSSGTTSDATTGSASTATAGATGSGAAPTTGSTTPTSGGTADAGAGTGTGTTSPVSGSTVDASAGTATGTDTTAQDTGSGSAGSTSDTSVGASGAGAVAVAVAVASTVPVAAQIVDAESRIDIAAEVDVTVSGTLAAKGSTGVTGGIVNILAGNNIALESGARILTTGQGANSSGGVVNILATNNAVTHKGAMVDASAGTSGDGGAIEFSAKNNVELAGGEFRADGVDGNRGSILIDPETITVSADILRGSPSYVVLPDGGSVSGADLTLLADSGITLNSGVTVSSRMVASDHIAGPSTGDSGNITFIAPTIVLKSGSQILANADGPFAGGTVTLDAKQDATNILGYRSATTSIQIGDDTGGATIKGGKIVVKAEAIADDGWTVSSGDPLDNAVNIASKALSSVASVVASSLGVDALYSQAKASASVIVKGGSVIESSGNVDLSATTTASAGAKPVNSLVQDLVPVKVKTPLAVGALYARVDADATVQVDGGAAIKATNFSALAKNNASVNASIEATPEDDSNSTSQKISVGVGITEADIQAKSSVSGTLDVSGSVKVIAINEGSYENEVKANTAGNGRAAAAVAYSTRTSDATAELRANVGDATKVQVTAVNDIVKDTVSAESTSGQSGTGEIVEKLKSGAEEISQQGLYTALGLAALKPKDVASNPDSPTQVKFRISGAIAYADHKDEAHASIEGAGVNVHASESIAVTAKVNAENTKISAQSSAVSNSSETPSASDTSRQGYSVGLALGSFEHNATAQVGSGVTLTAPRIGVLSETKMPMRESLLFGNTTPFDRWLGLSSITGAIESVTNIADVFNGVSSAKAKADGSQGSIALSGSVSILDFENNSRALVQEGAKLNLSGNATGAWSTDAVELAEAESKTVPFTTLVYDTKLARSSTASFEQAAEVRATNETELLFQGGPILPSSTGSEKGVGMALNDINVTSRAEALVREGVVIQGIIESASAGAAGSRVWTATSETASPEVNIAAKNSDKVISLTSTSGAGATFGLNGSVSVVTADATTVASLDDEASVNTKALDISANSSPVIWSLSGGINLSKGASVGVGVAVNDVTGDTRAQIADNDTYSSDGTARASALNIANYSATNLTGARISAPVMDVEAKTGGRVEAISVTGSVANQTDDEGGFFSDIKGKYDNLVTKAGSLVSLNPQAVSKSGGSSTQGTPQKPKFGLSAAGSASVNTTNINTVAEVAGVYIDQGKPAGYTDGQSLTVRSISDSDITTASGAAAVTRANSQDQKSATGIAGSIAVNQIGNGNLASVRNSTVVNGDDVTVQALSGGEQLSVAIGAAVDASKGANVRNKTSVVGSLSLTLAQTDDVTGKTKNFTRAEIVNAELTGAAAGANHAVDVTAYNRTFIGTGGGSLSVQAAGGSGKGTSVGGAVTYSDIRNDVDSRITGSTLKDFDSVGVNAYNATEIGAGAAMGGVSAVSNGNSIAGAFVITEIANHTNASIDGGSKVTARGSVTVQAKDKGADSALETLIDPDGKRTNIAKGLDYCGSDAGAGLTPGGNCITSVAGVAQFTRGNNVGVSASYNLIENNLAAKVEDATVSVTGAGGTIDIKADSSTDIVGLAIGVGASQKLSGAGSISIAEIHNTVTASASQSAAPAGRTTSLSADTITIDAKDASTIKTVGGQVVVSTQQSAIGAAVTYNDIENTVEARADGSSLSATTKASLSSENNSKIESLAVAGGVAKDAAVSASIALNFINNTTKSHSSATFDDQAGGVNTNQVSITAKDTSTIESLAGSVAIGKSAGAGAAFAYNAIGNAVAASLANAHVKRASTLGVSAMETAKITSLSVAAGLSKDVALSGSVSLNHIGNPDSSTDDGNVVTAEIDDSTIDSAATAVSVQAKDDSTIESLAGAVSISLGGPAVGGAVADNATHNLATARVNNSSLQGVAKLDVDGSNSSKIKSLSVAGSGGSGLAFAGSASSNRIENRTFGQITNAEITGSTADVKVNAIDLAKIESLAGSVAVGSNSVGAAIAVNRIANDTEAHVTGKKAGTSGLTVKNLEVKSDSLETIDTVAVAGAAGASNGGAGSFAINKIDSSTKAYIDAGAVVESEQNVGVIAESDDRITTSAGAIAVGGGGVGAGASVVVNEIGGTTAAYIDSATVAARAKAGTQTVNKQAVAKDSGVSTGKLTEAVNLADGLDDPADRPDVVAMRGRESATGVVVNASATHNLQNGVVNVGAGSSVGISGVANVNVIGGETTAYINQSSINQGDNTGATSLQDVQVRASDHAYGTSFVGGVAAGGAVGLGLTVDVSVFDRDTRAYVQNSTVKAADHAVVDAQSSQGMSTLVVGAAGGAVGLAGAGSVSKFTSQTEAKVSGGTMTVGSLDVEADHASRMFLSGGAIAIGGAAGVGATFDVGLDNSVTQAHIDNATVTTTGQVNVDAQSETEIHAWTVAGAAAGTVGAAGTASVALVGNKTQAWVNNSQIGSAGSRADGLAVTAGDKLEIEQNAGSLGLGGVAGLGVAAAVTKVANTTSAYMNNSMAHVEEDIVVDAKATRDMDTTVATVAGGLTAGIGGSIAVTLVGTELDSGQDGDTNANKELNKGGDGTMKGVNDFTSGNPLSSSNTTKPSDNGYANAGLSQSEIDSINSRATLDTNAEVYTASNGSAVSENFDPATQLTGKTAAVIGGNSVANANRDVKVTATELDRIKLATGGAAAGGLAGIGGSVSVAEVTNNVEAAILGTTQTTANADGIGTGKIDVIAAVGKLHSADAAVSAKAIQMSGGAVALGAAIAVADVTNNVKATIGRGTTTTVTSGSGNVNVHASDSVDMVTEALGASAGLVAAGVVIDRADKSGSVVARVGNENAPSAGSDTFVELDSGTLDVAASRSGSVTAKARAGSGGILAGSGADAKAVDQGSVKALIGNSTQVSTNGGKVSVTATATPLTRAEAFGVSVGAGSVGASLATARSNALVEAKIGESVDIEAAQLDVIASRLISAAGPTTSAQAFGASGGLLFGFNATVASADSGGTTRAKVGANSTLNVANATTVHADNRSLQATSGVGISIGGLVAVGSDYSRATSNTTTEAELGDGVKLTGQSLAVQADSSDTNFAHGIAGSGGMISAPFSESETNSISVTTARTGSGNNDVADARKIDVKTLNVSAQHTGQFDSWMENTNASLFGASGAHTTNNSEATTQAIIGAHGFVEADNLSVVASNTILKQGPAGNVPGVTSVTGGAIGKPSWNVNSSSGGLADVPAGGSDTTITNEALAQISANATVQHVDVVGAVKVPGTFSLDALNQITARDRVKMASGGLVSAATGSSIILAETNNATVKVGDNALVKGVADIAMGARSVADIKTEAMVDVYGLVGVSPEGTAKSHFNAVNTVDIGKAKLEAQNDIRLNAGANSAGTGSSSATVVARSDVFNNTVIPVNKDPVADAIINTNSQINIALGANVGASRDINLYADEGRATAEGVGVGKDIYREALAAVANAIGGIFGADEVSFETRTGRAVKTLTSNVDVQGDVHTGINRNFDLTLDTEILSPATATAVANWVLKCTLNGLQCPVGGADGISIDFQKGIAADINKRLNYLRTMADNYAGTAAAGAYLAEIEFLKRKLVDLGLATIENGNIILGTVGGSGISPKQAATTLKGYLDGEFARLNADELPPATTAFNNTNAALTTANDNSKYYGDRETALTTLSEELAKASDKQNATTITDAKAAAYDAEQLIKTNGGDIAGTFTALCTTASACIASPAAATSQKAAFDGSVKADAQTAFDIANAAKTRVNEQIDVVETAATNLGLQIPGLLDVPAAGPVADFVTLPNITAQLGSINVKGDSLTGKGKLLAPGDAKVSITNNTPNFMVVQDITVDTESARLNFNGVDVNNKADINRLNAPGKLAEFAEVVTGISNPSLPEVKILSNYDPNSNANALKNPAPDIRLTGDIYNQRGLVQVKSSAGSILSQGNVFAGTVDIKADNGDFVQSYTNNFFHAGGDPKTIYETIPPTTPAVPQVLPGGIFANGNILIHARYLNINGTVQSGYAAYDLVLPTSGAILTGSASQLGVVQGDLDDYRKLYLADKVANTRKRNYTNDEGIQVTYDADLNRLEMTEGNAATYATTVKGQTRFPKGIFAMVEDYGNIGANYDTVNDRYLLDSTLVNGGYIQLYGQIMNTASPGAGTGQGSLNVLDGYGQINITNPTGKDIVLGTLDTGKGVAGVIDITDIQYLDAASKAYSIKSKITRNNGVITTEQTGRWMSYANGLPVAGSFDESEKTTTTTGAAVGTYNPQAGLAYTYQIGTDQSTKTHYSYSGHTFFGLFDITQNLDQMTKYPSVSFNPRPIPEGNVLALDRPLSNDYYTFENVSVTPSGVPVTTNFVDGSTCDPWFCITQTYHVSFDLTSPTKSVDNYYLRADNPININFIGSDTGSVTVNSAQNVILTGAINNRNGTTTIVAGDSGNGVAVADKSIVQGNDRALISTNALNLTASGSIGGMTDGGKAVGGVDQHVPLVAIEEAAIRVAATGKVEAVADHGNVALKQAFGDLTIGTVSATGDALADPGKGKVNVWAEGSIVASTTAPSMIRGNSIDLTSVSGGIGSIATPLNVEVGYDSTAALRGHYGVTAQAQGDIGIESRAWTGNTGGDLLVNTAVSKGGDVKLVAAGAIIDNNPISAIDSRSQTALVSLWDELRLRGDLSKEKAAEAVLAYSNGKNNNYRLYWQLRAGQADQGTVYNAGYEYAVSDGERKALVDSGMDGAAILAFEKSRTDQYHTLHKEVGTFTTAFDGGYRYDASGEDAAIRKGATWSDAQLTLSLGAGLLKNITDTVTTVKSPNVKGKNIELVAGAAIGSLNEPVVITVPKGMTAAQMSAFLATLTDPEKAALAAAERGDTTVVENTVDNVITVTRPRSVNVETGTGALTASAAAGNAYIGSEEDLRINQISASGDIRIKAAGSLINATAAGAGIVNVTGGNIILESASGGIGAIPDSTTGALSSALQIDPISGKSLIARAAGDIWIETPGDLTVDTIYSRNNVRLDVDGSILDMPGDLTVTPAVNIRSKNIALTARNGSIGEDDNALDVGVNADGKVDATTETAGKGVHLNAPSGERITVNSSTSGGATTLSAANDLIVDGVVTGPGTISLVSGGKTTLTTKADVVSTALDVAVRAGSLRMEDNGTDAARIRTGPGSVDIETVGDAVITGIESGNGTASAVRVVSTAGRVLDGGDTRLDVIADTAPAAKFTVAGQLGVGSDGNPLDVRVRDLNAASVAGSVALAVVGGMNIEAVSAGDAVQITAAGNITGNSVASTGTGTQGTDKTVSVTSTGGSVTLASVTGTGLVGIDGQTGVNTGTVVSTGGSVTLNSNGGNVVADTTTAERDVTMTAPTGTITAKNTTARNGSLTMNALGDINAGNAKAGGSAAINSQVGQVTVDTLSTGGAFAMTTRGDIKTGVLTSGGAISLTSTGGRIQANSTTSFGSSVDMTAQGSVDANNVGAATDIKIASRSSNVNVGTGSANTIDLSAPGAVTGGSLNVGSSVKLAGQNIAAAVNSTGGGDVGGSITGFGGGQASNVQLSLNSPYAFRFATLATSTGDINITAGDLSVGSLWVGNRMTVSNPFTRIVIDQNDRTKQGFDVQLYSAGNPFAFGITARRVTVDEQASLIARKPTHEVISPLGNNLSAEALGYREMAVLDGRPLPTDLSVNSHASDSRSQGDLVSFDGTPVATDEDCDKEGSKGGSAAQSAQCEEKNL